MESFKHKGKRRKLVELLQEKGIEDERVLNAINQVPRHLFLNSVFEDHAYEDKAFPIAADQTISHPYTVAFQSSLLDLHPGEKVLEIGTGSGYQTAVLVAMGAEVYTIERQKNLVDFSRNMLQKINLEPKYQTYGDGYKGLPSFAPFDKIIVTAGAPSLPTLLVQQLKIGGIAVIPIGEENQKMYTYLRVDERKYEQMEFGAYKFVPMLEKRDDI
ncbi:protein-L-isoaspartate(D-aspartate) O-methyltransferase [Flavobacteriaceae bacterium Ap0902]|nr:protein-L-isoaspartate(D-aspartate) O-methyltransferase [Flavobacteriaceae bacterium Ap0902]